MFGWLVQALLPSALGWIQGYLVKKGNADEALQNLENFKMSMQKHGLMAVSLTEDAEAQKKELEATPPAPPVPPAPPSGT